MEMISRRQHFQKSKAYMGITKSAKARGILMKQNGNNVKICSEKKHTPLSSYVI